MNSHNLKEGSHWLGGVWLELEHVPHPQGASNQSRCSKRGNRAPEEKKCFHQTEKFLIKETKTDAQTEGEKKSTVNNKNNVGGT